MWHSNSSRIETDLLLLLRNICLQRNGGRSIKVELTDVRPGLDPSNWSTAEGGCLSPKSASERALVGRLT